MATNVDLKLGLNLTIGSVPVALDAEVKTEGDDTTYSFNGCVQDAQISLSRFISFVGEQFGVAVDLPPELNSGPTPSQPSIGNAVIDYVAGQVIYKKKDGKTGTELGVAGKFTLTIGQSPYSLQFYADVQIENPAPETGNPYVVGASIDTELEFSKLPLVGQIPGF